MVDPGGRLQHRTTAGRCRVSAITPLVVAAMFFIAGCLYLLILIAAFCAVAALARKARLRLRFRRVPADGPPLKPDEQYALKAIERGWKDSAAEPEYDVEEDL